MGYLSANSYQFHHLTAVGRWEWTVRVELVTSPTYSVVNIKSPYGLLRDSIPLPGDVVEQMALSIESLRTAFPSTLTLGPSLVFTVDEGRGVSGSQSFTVTNGGVFGSAASVAIVSSVPYVRVTPSAMSGLSPSETGTAQVSVDSSGLLAGSYSGTLTVTDPNATNSPQVGSVAITVRPKATIGRSPSSLSFTVARPLSGPYPAIPTQTLTIQNTGPVGSVLGYTVAKLIGTSDWLNVITPTQGTLASAATQAVTIGVAPATSYLYGTYTETLRISGYSSNSYLDVPVTLTIT